MKDAISIGISILLLSALMILQINLNRQSEEIRSNLIQTYKQDLGEIVKSVYSPMLISDKEEIIWNLRNEILVLDNINKTLIITDEPKILNNDSMDVLSSVIIKNMEVSIHERQLDRIKVDIKSRSLNRKWYEEPLLRASENLGKRFGFKR